MSKEKPKEYAQRRADETGRPYLVTEMGHAMLFCPHNARWAKQAELSFVVFKPNKPSAAR